MLYVPLQNHPKINIHNVTSILFLFCVLECHLWIPTWSAREEVCLHYIPDKQLKRQTFHAKRDGREREGIVEGNKWKSIVTGSSPVIYGPILILSSCPDHHHHQQPPVNAGKLNIVQRESQKVPLFPKLSPTDNVKRISTTVPYSISVSQQKNALLLFLVEVTSLVLKYSYTTKQRREYGCVRSGLWETEIESAYVFWRQYNII